MHAFLSSNLEDVVLLLWCNPRTRFLPKVGTNPHSTRLRAISHQHGLCQNEELGSKQKGERDRDRDEQNDQKDRSKYPKIKDFRDDGAQ